MRALLLLGLAGLTLTAPGARGMGTEREMFDRADKVVLGMVVHLGLPEDAPGSTRARPYRYQRWWVREEKVFKGPPAPAHLGYDVVLAPVRVHHRSPSAAFRQDLTVSDLPPDATVLLYLRRDVSGAWTLLDGRDGYFRYPGPTRRKNLEAWAKARPRSP